MAVCQWVECPGFCVVAVLLLVWLWRMVIERAAAKLLCDRGILERESAKFDDSLSSKLL